MLRLCCAAHERMRAKPLAFDDFFVCARQKRSALSGTLRCGPTIGAEWDRGLGNRNRNVWQSACLGPSWLGGSDVSLKTGWNSPVRLALERRRVGCSSPMCLEASSPACSRQASHALLRAENQCSRKGPLPPRLTNHSILSPGPSPAPGHRERGLGRVAM